MPTLRTTLALAATALALHATAHDRTGATLQPLGFFQCTAVNTGLRTLDTTLCVGNALGEQVVAFRPDATARFIEFGAGRAFDHERAHERVVDADGLPYIKRAVYALHGNHAREIDVSLMRNDPPLPANAIITGVQSDNDNKRLYAMDMQTGSLLSWDFTLHDEHNDINNTHHVNLHATWTARTPLLLKTFFVARDFVLDADAGLLWVVAHHTSTTGNVYGPSLLCFDANGNMLKTYSFSLGGKGSKQPYGLWMDKTQGRFYIGDGATRVVHVRAIPDTSAFVKSADF